MNNRQRKLKLLFYCPALTDGGAERVWALLANEFARRGHDVSFAVDREAANGPALDPKTRLTVLPDGHVASVRALRRLLRQQQPNAALASIAASPLKLALALLGLSLPTRAICAFHGFEEWRTGKLTRLTWAALPWITRRSAAIVAVSDALRRELVHRWRIDPDRTVRIHNPVAFPEPPPKVTKEDLRTRAPVILAIGRLSKEKCFPLLLRAITRLKTQDATLAILGEGPQRRLLENEITRLNLTDRVTLPGYQSDIWPWLARAKCLALPSRTESFGNVVVEALAAGLPVVATDTPGPREIMGRNTSLGHLVPVDDEEAFAAALDAALASPGEPAPRQARAAHFSVRSGVDNWEALIRKVCQP